MRATGGVGGPVAEHRLEVARRTIAAALGQPVPSAPVRRTAEELFDSLGADFDAHKPRYLRRVS